MRKIDSKYFFVFCEHAKSDKIYTSDDQIFVFGKLFTPNWTEKYNQRQKNECNIRYKPRSLGANAEKIVGSPI